MSLEKEIIKMLNKIIYPTTTLEVSYFNHYLLDVFCTHNSSGRNVVYSHDRGELWWETTFKPLDILDQRCGWTVEHKLHLNTWGEAYTCLRACDLEQVTWLLRAAASSCNKGTWWMGLWWGSDVLEAKRQLVKQRFGSSSEVALCLETAQNHFLLSHVS